MFQGLAAMLEPASISFSSSPTMDWNRRYETNDTPWERGEPAPPLLEYFEGDHPISGKVLVPGCGSGNDARFLASRGCDVVGLDISHIALQRAETYAPPRNGTLSYLLGDFLDSRNQLPAAHFDCIFEHTCFCTLDPDRRADYVEAAARALKPSGLLLAIFFTYLEDENGPPYSCFNDAIESLFSPRFDILNSWKPTRCFPGRENEETMYLLRKR